MNNRRLEGVRPLLLSIPYTIRLSTSSTTAAVLEVGCASSAWREAEERERESHIYLQKLVYLLYWLYQGG